MLDLLVLATAVIVAAFWAGACTEYVWHAVKHRDR